MTATDETLLQRRAHRTECDANGKTAKPASKASKSLKLTAINEELKTATSASTHRVWTRSIVILAVVAMVCYYAKYQNRERKFALALENVQLRMARFNCSPAYQSDIEQYSQCVPAKCGRFVADKRLSDADVLPLVGTAREVFANANSSGGASILDLHTGALSYGDKFVNIYKAPALKELVHAIGFDYYNTVKDAARKEIGRNFKIPSDKLYLTHPTFFSRLTNATAKTVHDEYWHEHVDKETYPSFHYTSLFYLSTYSDHFEGGRLVFVSGAGDSRITTIVEPKLGRMVGFTSGAENRHYVERVTRGERYAITISFTCDPKLAIADPHIPTKLRELKGNANKQTGRVTAPK